MANHHTNLQSTNSEGNQVSVQHTSTDSPILPAANLEQLKLIDPSLIPFVVEQTKLEAAARRKSNSQVNLYIFIEKISGVIVGGLVAIIVFLIGGYLVLQGHDAAGVGICGTALGTIIAVLVNKGMSSSKTTSPPAAPARKPRARSVK